MKNQQAVRLGTFVAGMALMVFALAMGNAMAGQSPPANLPVVGNWNGALNTGSGWLRVVVHVTQDKNGNLAATLDSPDQGAQAMGIPINLITIKDSDLHFEIEIFAASYDGTLNKDHSEIAGTWKQGGASLPLNFIRTDK